ncbi:hypothetical protein XM38_039490 [Halomicronema hongdechloris C2206]|uniref:Uncharacterized protein n=1 Tax=Halomicronema hongdechloris C2206 TaxID=1641165 RepID=A0A1Z3HRS0_9CYAN|nr:hypothetical protein [Halomicronema hongdechloris]ASC72988.1 hypothetical protein XM38_039490 [Halomicronema hongdechloris C2206]
MATPQDSPADRSVQVGGDITGSAVVTGDHNTVQVQPASLPSPETVDIQAELKALQTLLAGFDDPVATGVAQKLAQEAAKPEPDKSAIATTLETGLTYAQSLAGFAEAIDKLRPHVEAAAGWLGKQGYKLLPLVGLTL